MEGTDLVGGVAEATVAWRSLTGTDDPERALCDVFTQVLGRSVRVAADRAEAFAIG
ncbi:MAG TPA: hypothetical protein VMU14_15510 [Acidimicrobiales bacterium]|nr:hypothetical protein [Acidimicrobiales bacterium]